MANRVIVISRKYGAGGHSVAEALSEKLGIPYYDQDLIAEIAFRTGFSKETVEAQGEQMENTNFLLNTLRGSRFETNKQERIWEATKKVIRDLAAKESCIILGRCSNYVLRNVPGVVSVYLHADDVRCAERIREITGELPMPEVMARVDKRRAAFYQYYTDWTWNDANRYTISLDTGKLGIDRCVDIIAELYKN